VSFVCPEIDDGRAPLDLDPAAAYRFALQTSLTSRSHLPGLKQQPLPLGEAVLGRPVRAFLGAAQFPLKIRSVIIFIFPPVLNFDSDLVFEFKFLEFYKSIFSK
jgi:hypothetical protein